MILIDTKHNKAYSNVSIVECSRRIGIGERQIKRWIKYNDHPLEVFNYWTLYFDEIRLKQKKGFALSK